jgi:hypothetical protein
LVALWVLDRLDAEFLATAVISQQTSLDNAPWIRGVTLADPQRALAYAGLDRGEAEVLALASERDARLVLIDERRARRYAQRLGVPITGTVGLLLLAKEKGLVPAVAPLLTTLTDNGLYLSDALVSEALQLAGEETTDPPG